MTDSMMLKSVRLLGRCWPMYGNRLIACSPLHLWLISKRAISLKCLNLRRRLDAISLDGRLQGRLGANWCIVVGKRLTVAFPRGVVRLKML